MRPKSEIYTPKRDDEYPHPFHMRSPPLPSIIHLFNNCGQVVCSATNILPIANFRQNIRYRFPLKKWNLRTECRNRWILMPKKPNCWYHIGVKDTSEKLELSMIVLPCFRTWTIKLYQNESEIGFPGCGISLIWSSRFGILKQNEGEIRDWKNAGIRDFENNYRDYGIARN